MSKAKRSKAFQEEDPFRDGIIKVRNHPLFSSLAKHAHIRRAIPSDVYSDGSPAPSRTGWAAVDATGDIIAHPTRRATSSEWAYVFAHCLLHLAFRHHEGQIDQREWQVACCATVTRFLRDMKFPGRTEDINDQFEVPETTELSLYRRLVDRGMDEELLHLSVSGRERSDLLKVQKRRYWRSHDWQELFAEGLTAAVQDAVRDAANRKLESANDGHPLSRAQRAKHWFINNYPLLGALAASFKLIESPSVCSSESIPIAAVNSELRELYINSSAKLSEDECKFVMAHEFMHVGLRHETRRQGRDVYLWNVACDFVINSWLIEMGVGQPPPGLLHDDELKGLSAEGVYDRIVTDLRRARKLCTLRGNCAGHGDILDGSGATWWQAGEGVTLDEFYRRCLFEGLNYHLTQGRGFLPAGLIEEINALSQPPIPWDVELAQWFDEHFPPLEKIRTYSRPSRRQSSTPSIPRPRYIPPPEGEGRTFAVILDTSGSMDRTLLAKALGAIASYSAARDVVAARVVFCDAAPYDQGYLAPEDIARNVRVKGRGGTVLQPAIDLLEKAADFPDDGPMLIITDGMCDVLRIKREHAFLMPESATLPFCPHGRIFRIK